MKKENKDQEILRVWITKGLEILDKDDLRGDAKYLLNNMIAKYSLFADNYVISEQALKRLESEGFNLDEIHTRNKLYGKATGFIYEHSIPATIIRNELLNCKNLTDLKKIKEILSAGEVFLLLRTEDDTLNSNGLKSKMPEDWSFGDDNKARYNEVGISISTSTLLVNGAVKR